MTLHLQTTSSKLAGLTAWQQAAIEQIWDIAGLPAMAGYERVFLLAAISSDYGLRQTLSLLDLDDPESVRSAVTAVLQWRKCVMD